MLFIKCSCRLSCDPNRADMIEGLRLPGLCELECQPGSFDIGRIDLIGVPVFKFQGSCAVPELIDLTWLLLREAFRQIKRLHSTAFFHLHHQSLAVVILPDSLVEL